MANAGTLLFPWRGLGPRGLDIPMPRGNGQQAQGDPEAGVEVGQSWTTKVAVSKRWSLPPPLSGTLKTCPGDYTITCDVPFAFCKVQTNVGSQRARPRLRAGGERPRGNKGQGATGAF